MNKIVIHRAKWVIPTIVAVIVAVPASAATRTCTGGNMSDPNSWGGTVPGVGDTLRIDGICTVDDAFSNLAYGSLTVGRAANGTLQWPAGGTATLNVTAISTQGGRTGTIDMTNGGTLQVRTSWSLARQTFIPGAGTVNWNVTGGGGSTLPATTYNNLTITTANRVASLGGSTTINGNLLISTGTLSAGTRTLSIAGDFTNNAAFTPGSGTVTFDGTAAQALGGAAATTFNNLTINKTTGNVTVTSASAALSPTINGTLNLQSGLVITTVGTNDVGVGTSGTISGGSTTSYVVGAVQKNYGLLSGQQLIFPVGDATNYTPVAIQGSGFTSGSLTISTTGGADHPSIASSGIDATKSVNRYWTLSSVGLPAGSSYNATFNYISGSPVDLDSGAIPANFIVEHWNGASWLPSTNGACTSTNCQITGETGFGDFAIGEPLAGVTALPGQFNAFDTTTPTGAVLGMVQTKQSGIAFSVRVVHLTTAKNAIDTTYSPPLFGTNVTVELLDSSDNTGAMNATTACRPIGAGVGQWHVIAGTTQTVNFNAGVATATFAAIPNSYRDVRVHVVKTVLLVTDEGCSTDRFAIRPQSLTVTAWDADWQTAGTGRSLANTAAIGGNVHKASTSTATTPRPFTLRAEPVPATATNYDGSPTTVSGFPSCGTPLAAALCNNPGALSYTASSWTTTPAGSGVRENATANYSEAGAFNLELEDQAYADVDSVDGTPLATRTVPPTAAAQIGRFVPDHFVLAANNAPQFRTFNNAACAVRSFTYAGQPFAFVTTPEAGITPQNAGDGTTTNYTGSLWKLAAANATQTYATIALGGTISTNSASASVTGAGTTFTTQLAAGRQLYTASGALIGTVQSIASDTLLTLTANAGSTNTNIPYYDPPLDVSLVGTNPMVMTAPGAATSCAGGASPATGTLCPSPDNIWFSRGNIPYAKFPAAISLSMDITDPSENGVAGNGVIGATAPVSFRGTSPDGGITWTGITWDSGNEIRYGRLRLSNAYGSELLNMVIPIQTQYWSGTGFATNAADNCTTLTANNIRLTAAPAGVSALVGGAFSSGIGSLRLTKPSPAASGTVDLCADLGADPVGGTVCSAASTANMPYLKGLWAPGTTYDNDPTALATFAIYKGSSEFIYMHEAY